MKKLKKAIEVLKYDDSLRHELYLTLALLAAAVIAICIKFL